MNAPLRPFPVDLNGVWEMAYALEPTEPFPSNLDELKETGWSILEARVPGNFELDLQRNGRIEDPFCGMNIVSLFVYEKAHVWWGRRFPCRVPEGHRASLVLEGLDCYGEVFLNGTLLGETDNMLVEHRFDVTDLLRGENEIFIHVRPALLQAQSVDYPAYVAAGGIQYESLYVRKAPHMYGWDIMPRALSSGLWRPAHIDFLPENRLSSLFLETLSLSQSGDRAQMLLHYGVAVNNWGQDLWEVALEGHCGTSHVRTRDVLRFSAGKLRLDVLNPVLWWPNGYGEPSLYECRASLLRNGQEVDALEFRTGIRTVSLDRTSLTDREGSGEFQFRINGVKIFCKGSNWVPLDAYHSRDEERVDKAIELAVNAHCNMLRCWGGNVYESDRFFDLCDEKGLMVWQDFAMACAVYPQDETFANRLAEEAQRTIRRLRKHPSLILWAGDNECDQAFSWFGLGDPNQNVLTRKVLPEVLRQEDPHRPYLPSSPYIDERAYRASGHDLPEDHLWGPREYYKGQYYVRSTAHFASEIGYHGCPSPESIREFISKDKLWPPWDNEEWRLHGTSPVPGYTAFDFRIQLMANQVRALFGMVPDTLEDFAFASQVTQAEAKKFFIERFRSAKWRRTGILWWNLLDGWPQFSDAVVDYYFRAKLAYHVICRSQQHLCLILREPEDQAQDLVVSNDTRRMFEIEYEVRDTVEDKLVLAGIGHPLPNEVTWLGRVPYDMDQQRFYRIHWTGEGVQGNNHYLAGKPPFSLEQLRKGYGCAGYL